MSLSSPIRLSHQRPIDKEFEDADDNGVLNLSGRNLRMFPNVPGELCDFADVFEAGKSFTSKLVSPHLVLQVLPLSIYVTCITVIFEASIEIKIVEC